MSKEELLTAYAEGALSRRMFVRRLVAAGVSAGAAVSYAQLLAPGEASARGGGAINDHYPLLTMKILTRDLSNVISKGRLVVQATVGENSFPAVAAFVKKQGNLTYLGSAGGNLLLKGSKQNLKIPIAVDDLKGHKSVQIYVNASVSSSDYPYPSTVASTKATLK